MRAGSLRALLAALPFALAVAAPAPATSAEILFKCDFDGVCDPDRMSCGPAGLELRFRVDTGTNTVRPVGGPPGGGGGAFGSNRNGPVGAFGGAPGGAVGALGGSRNGTGGAFGGNPGGAVGTLGGNHNGTGGASGGPVGAFGGNVNGPGGASGGAPGGPVGAFGGSPGGPVGAFGGSPGGAVGALGGSRNGTVGTLGGSPGGSPTSRYSLVIGDRALTIIETPISGGTTTTTIPIGGGWAVHSVNGFNGAIIAPKQYFGQCAAM